MSKSQAQLANEQIISQVLRKKMDQDARPSKAPRVSFLQSANNAAGAPGRSLPPSAHNKIPPARPNERTVTFAAARNDIDGHGHVHQGSRGRHESASRDSSAQRLLPSQLLQQGVESMGGALEVSPSAFGGFTVREDFVMAMRLNISHAQSMPAEGDHLRRHMHARGLYSASPCNLWRGQLLGSEGGSLSYLRRDNRPAVAMLDGCTDWVACCDRKPDQP